MRQSYWLFFMIVFASQNLFAGYTNCDNTMCVLSGGTIFLSNMTNHCRVVENTGLIDIMYSTKTDAEFDSFVQNAAVPGVTINSCTCTDITNAAACTETPGCSWDAFAPPGSQCT